MLPKTSQLILSFTLLWCGWTMNGAAAFAPLRHLSSSSSLQRQNPFHNNNDDKMAIPHGQHDSRIMAVPTVGAAIDWSNPTQAFVGGFFLLYVGFSVLAGIKYVVKDGWRPKL